ncbi:hypothetical protein GDO86_001398 [Hymenochirus boettgeri]|uniref:Uncharacterized protein n=1 Tax=Hymenochirus boettgeri TaxID=247094 RepID=A0A8T2KCK2_9PIPI|nr:hypothetical protein GDO86_001398 [Hymenochirus boettgeri]
MQNQMRERQMAMQIAWSREFLKYYGSFFSLAGIKNKKPGLFIPIVLRHCFCIPVGMGYGTLLTRMKGEAENILENEKSLLEIPQGMPTFDGIEKARRHRGRFSD